MTPKVKKIGTPSLSKNKLLGFCKGGNGGPGGGEGGREKVAGRKNVGTETSHRTPGEGQLEIPQGRISVLRTCYKREGKNINVKELDVRLLQDVYKKRVGFHS